MNKHQLNMLVAKTILVASMMYLVWAIMSDHSMETCLQRHSAGVCQVELR